MSGLANKNRLFLGVFAGVLWLVVNLGGAEYAYLVWKLVGWTIVAFFALGVILLPLYCFNILMPALLTQRLSAREQICAKALSLTLGFGFLVLFLNALH